jgi:hypothetical protein
MSTVPSTIVSAGPTVDVSIMAPTNVTLVKKDVATMPTAAASKATEPDITWNVATVTALKNKLQQAIDSNSDEVFRLFHSSH